MCIRDRVISARVGRGLVIILSSIWVAAVSYTHLDVYKRQPKGCRVPLLPHGEAQGNGCPKGADYARQEATAPKRVLTTTLKRPDGTLLPVKTSAGVPKDNLLSCMAVLRRCAAPAGPVPWGQVVLPLSLIHISPLPAGR